MSDPGIVKKNIEHLKSVVGTSIVNATRELYYYEDTLDTESMGEITLEFSNGIILMFDCHSDAETLSIQPGKIDLKQEEDVELKTKWVTITYDQIGQLRELGAISAIKIEKISTIYGDNNGGVKMCFASGDFFYIFTTLSDNIHYGINHIPSYHSKKAIKVTLTDITRYNNG